MHWCGASTSRCSLRCVAATSGRRATAHNRPCTRGWWRLVATYGNLTHAKEYDLLLLLLVCVYGEEIILLFLLLLPVFPGQAPRLSLIWKLNCRAWRKPRDMPIRHSCWRSCAMASARCSDRICSQPCTRYVPTTTATCFYKDKRKLELRSSILQISEVMIAV